MPRPVRALFVTPSELSSGEALTALYMAEDICRRGGRCVCLASSFTARFIESRLGAGVVRLSDDPRVNRRLWQQALDAMHPNVVVFADYPLLFFSNGTAPLVDERWVASLDALDATLVTLDHLGYAQREMPVFFGPPHLSLHTEVTPPLPSSMRILLPCPMNEPLPVSGRAGTPFSYLGMPRNGADRSSVARKRAGDPLLIVHTTPTWAWRIAAKWSLPHYTMLPVLLEQLLKGLSHPVRVVSVNRGDLLSVRNGSPVEIVNSGPLSPTRYDALLAAADLLITDNAVSSTSGKAVHSLTPVVRLRNSRRLLEIVEEGEPWARSLALAMDHARPGAVFPFEVFPLWDTGDLERLGLFRENSMERAVEAVEMFGGEDSRRRVQSLLLDDGVRGALRQRQEEYVTRLALLPGPNETLEALIGETTAA